MRRIYVHQQPGWPKLTWDAARLAEPMADLRHRQGRLIGRMAALGFKLRQEASLHTLTADVVKTSEIEGERLNIEQVRSSLARRLGIEIGALKPADRHVDGVVEMMLDATGNHAKPLTAKRLFAWHAALFPTGRSGLSTITVGAWRTGPMEVVSGPVGRRRVHFAAPSPARLKREMAAFLKWFNGPEPMDNVLKSGIAHLWFITIHPFDDGNGRIARAIADMCLARSEKSSQRFYSVSSQIRQERARYYEVLERTQKGRLDVTPWMEWYLGCLGRAIDSAEGLLAQVLAKARFLESIQGITLNERQSLVLNRFLDGFQGNLTTAKYAKLAKCSHDTALRDIQSLVERGVLAAGPEGGRSTSYALAPRRKG
ncbi:MAG: Fic family protein [Chloroflexi bacterium]|nr:Fic family protein [Chloroflexota bacterium]